MGEQVHNSNEPINQLPIQPNQKYQDTPTPKNTHQGSSALMILLVVLVALIAGGSVWAYYNYKVIPDLGLQPSSSYTKKQTSVQTTPLTPVKEWKNYSNDDQKFSIDYPRDWNVKVFSGADLKKEFDGEYGSDAGKSTSLIFFSSIKITKFPKPYPENSIWMNVTKASDLANGADAALMPPNGMEPANEKSVTQDKVRGKKYIGEDENDIVYVFFTNGIKYMIGISNKPTESISRILNSMVESIEFTR